MHYPAQLHTDKTADVDGMVGKAHTYVQAC